MSLWIKLLHFIFYSVVNTLIKYFENIKFFLHVSSDISVIFLLYELLPTLKTCKLFFIVHTCFEPLQHVKQFSYQKISNCICNFDFLSSFHCLFSNSSQENVNISSMQNVSWISFKCSDLFLSICFFILNFFIIFNLMLSICFNIFFHHINWFFSLTVSFDNIAIKLLFCFFIYNIVCVIVKILLFLDFFWMVNNHVGLKIKLWYVHCKIVFFIIKSLIHIFFDFLLQITDNWMVEQVLPFNSFFRVNCQHSSNDIFRYFWNLVYTFWKAQWFIFYIVDQINHVACFIWWRAK